MGSEMCIRDSPNIDRLLQLADAADAQAGYEVQLMPADGA